MISYIMEVIWWINFHIFLVRYDIMKEIVGGIGNE